MASSRPDFNQINKLIDRLETLESDFVRIFDDEQAQRQALQGICRQAARAQAVGALADIPVGELKNSRAGIRTAALEQAGFQNLLDLYRAPDYALQAADGIGEKQAASIRVILDEFLNRLAERERIRLTVEMPGEENADGSPSADLRPVGEHDCGENAELTRELIHGLSVYRHADIIRRDARSIRIFRQRIP